MTTRQFVAVTFDALELQDAPIRPAWVRSGSPRARMVEIARSDDGTAVTVAWDCTRGTFDWIFGVDETVHIVEGEVTVAQAGAPTRTLRPGDVAFFPSGCATVWTVDTYVRKLAVCRHAMPAPLGLALRVWNKLRSLISREPAAAQGLGAASAQA